MIYLSKSAAKEISRLRAKALAGGDGVRLSIAPGGCAGWRYSLGFAGEVGVGDRRYDCEGIPVIIDAESVESTHGMTVDYSEDLMGGGFRFHNPQAASTCSCGNSFARKSKG